ARGSATTTRSWSRCSGRRRLVLTIPADPSRTLKQQGRGLQSSCSGTTRSIGTAASPSSRRSNATPEYTSRSSHIGDACTPRLADVIPTAGRGTPARGKPIQWCGSTLERKLKRRRRPDKADSKRGGNFPDNHRVGELVGRADETVGKLSAVDDVREFVLQRASWSVLGIPGAPLVFVERGIHGNASVTIHVELGPPLQPPLVGAVAEHRDPPIPDGLGLSTRRRCPFQSELPVLVDHMYGSRSPTLILLFGALELPCLDVESRDLRKTSKRIQVCGVGERCNDSRCAHGHHVLHGAKKKCSRGSDAEENRGSSHRSSSSELDVHGQSATQKSCSSGVPSSASNGTSTNTGTLRRPP